MSDDWRPGAELKVLRAREHLLRTAREYFYERDVLEIETPLLDEGNVPDPEICSIVVQQEQRTTSPNGERKSHLQTSPELAMKRFVAAEQVSCFQICKAFRSGELGRRHNPEFTLLEWYRVHMEPTELINEVVGLIDRTHRALVPAAPRLGQIRTSYRSLFEQYLTIDPCLASDQQLADLVAKQGVEGLERDGALTFLFAHCIEPRLPERTVVVVDRYPASQAALARLDRDADGTEVSQRFEVFLGPLELANGYFELTDAAEQAKRFARDSRERRLRGLPNAGSQQKLLEALSSGLPDCSGVALGIDRLLMALLDLQDLSQVVAFR